MKKIIHLFYWIFICKPSGVLVTKKKHREKNFQVGLFGWSKYTPKHKEHIIKTISIKDQNPYNTCTFNAACVQKEIDENEVLSVRSMVAYAKRMGYIRSNGFSTLENAQKVLLKFGAMRESSCPDIKQRSFKDYTNPSKLDYVEAGFRKTKSFWEVKRRADILKLLDEGRAMATAKPWYSGFNRSGGFNIPWLIEKIVGYFVGYHSTIMIGYNMDYKGKECYVFQNSYGKLWGDRAKYYVTMDWFDKKNTFGCFAQLDTPHPVGKFLMDNNGKNVKVVGDPGVYHLQNGVKKVYPDEISFFAFNKSWDGIVETTKDILDKIPNGDVMDIEKSLYWPFIKNLKKPYNLARLMDIYLK